MKTLIAIVLSFTLLACTQPAENPQTITDKYWQLLQSGNITEAEKLVSTSSRRDYPQHTNRINSISQLETSNAQTFVSTTITTINPVNNFSHSQTFNTVLVLQQGEWKIDVSQSQIPPSPSAQEEEMQKLAEELSESMQENIESIDESLNQGMQLLNEALREGSKEMGESLLNMMNELNSSMKESIDKMKERKQQTPDKNSPEQNPQPNTDQGEGMI